MSESGGPHPRDLSLAGPGLRTDRDRLARSFLTAGMLVNDGSFAEAVPLVDEILPDALVGGDRSGTTTLVLKG
jgi:hypothetical protein